jgi:hypothetical protein
MPKMKSHSGAAKRFTRTANGGFKCGASHRRHILTACFRIFLCLALAVTPRFTLAILFS